MQQEPNIPQPEQNLHGSQDSPDHSPKREGLKSVVSTILILIAAPIIALLLTSFVFQSYEVDGPSMEQTLQNTDRLIVLKTGKTWSTIFRSHFIPKRGEIIVFTKNDSPNQNGAGNRQLIKRVVGLPGDRVVVSGGAITIYNKEHPDGFNPDANHKYTDNIAKSTPGNVDITVPQNEVFVAGDNRTNSLDSRYFGTVSSDDIVGNLVLRIYPFSKFEAF